MQAEGRVGLITGSSGSVNPLATGEKGDLVSSLFHGRYYHAAKAGRLFTAANQAGVVTVVGLHTTYTGLVLSNPIASGIDVSLLRVGVGFIVAQPTTGAIVALEAGYNGTTDVTHSVPSTTLRNCYLGGAAPVANVDTGATLPTAPTVIESFGSVLTEAITANQVQPAYTFDLGGYLILPPGGYCAIYTTIASGAASMVASFIWEEATV